MFVLLLGMLMQVDNPALHALADVCRAVVCAQDYHHKGIGLFVGGCAHHGQTVAKAWKYVHVQSAEYTTHIF